MGFGPRTSSRVQCVFDYATRGHCRVGRNTTVLAPGCGLATCTDSKADAQQAKGAKAYRDGVCQQRHQARDRKKKALQLR